MGKILSNSIRKFDTTIHLLEFSPKEFNVALTEGVLGKKEPLTAIRHNWYESNGYKRVGGVNCQFFGSYTQGMQYVDSGFITIEGTPKDVYLECIFEDGTLKLDDITGKDVKIKYPRANWAMGVGFGLVKDGVINTMKSEYFYHYPYKHPRTAIGQKANGNLVLIATDGRETGSAGLSGRALAQVALDIGCVVAASFDGGGSTMMALDERDGEGYKIINKLQGNYERPITSALLVYAKDWEVVETFEEEKVEGMQAYIIKGNQLQLNTSGSSANTYPLRLSANAYKVGGLPLGLVASKGMVYNALPEGLPALVVYIDGGVDIVEAVNAKQIAQSKFVISGTAMLIKDSEILDVVDNSPLKLLPTSVIPRMGVGVIPDGRLMFIIKSCTLEELQECMYSYGSTHAMMLAYGDVYVDYPDGGIHMGTTMPVTVLEALDFKALPRPIIVLDAGHGGIDPGAVGFGKLEKDFNLKGAKIVHQYLMENFEGTFVMTRIDDSTMSLSERSKLANLINADVYLSLHCNAYNGAASGYETFIYTTPLETERKIQSVLHGVVMNFLTPFGFPDRGRKQANFHVLREVKCPSVLVENLFVDNPKDNEFLSDDIKFKALYLATAKGFAEGVGLLPKVSTEIEDVDARLYRVQVGAFSVKSNAEALAERLKKDGYDTYIVRQ